MKIRDVVTNLETKLNTAIVSEINDIQEEGEPTALETDRYTTRFILDLDTGKYKGYEWLKKNAQRNADGYFDNSALSKIPTGKFVRLINGIIAITGSNVEGGFTAEQNIPKNLAFTATLTLFIPMLNDTEDNELVTSIREIVDKAMSLNFYGEFAGYNMSVVYALGRTGERMSIKGIGDFITLRCNLEYAFVEGGVNSTQMIIRYLDTAIYTTVKAMSRVASQKGDVDLSQNTNEQMSVTQSTVFTLSFDKPLQIGAFDDICARFILEGDTGEFYPITVSIPTRTGVLTKTYNMCFNSVQINGQNALNAGMSVAMTTANDVTGAKGR